MITLEPDLELTLQNLAEQAHISVNEVINRLLANQQQDTPFIVNVSVYQGVWTAECDTLGLVTEAESYEQLIKRALEIAPELADTTLSIKPEAIKLRFLYEQSTLDKII